MIISHKHKFIFFKTNKTAGTSIEIALSRFCGPEDIITPISPEDEKTRKELGYPGPQNYFLPISSYSFKDITRWLFKGKRKQFYNHITAEEVRSLIDDHTWNDYYKFCFDRNPWDRIISLYYWRCKTEPRPTITEFLDSTIPQILKKRGYELYTINQKIAVDKVCLYENLSKELEAVKNHIGITGELELPQAKSQFRKGKHDYHSILGKKEKEKIALMFRDEISLFGYEF